MTVEEYIMVLATLPQDMEVMGVHDEFGEAHPVPVPKVERIYLDHRTVGGEDIWVAEWNRSGPNKGDGKFVVIVF